MPNIAPCTKINYATCLLWYHCIGRAIR